MTSGLWKIKKQILFAKLATLQKERRKPMTQNVILLSVARFSITDEKTGMIENDGCTVRYILSENLFQCEDSKKSIKGFVPAKATIPFEDYSKLQTVPGLYEMTLDFNVNSKGEAKLKPTAFKFLSGITVSRTAAAAATNV